MIDLAWKAFNLTKKLPDGIVMVISAKCFKGPVEAAAYHLSGI